MNNTDITTFTQPKKNRKCLMLQKMSYYAFAQVLSTTIMVDRVQFFNTPPTSMYFLALWSRANVVSLSGKGTCCLRTSRQSLSCALLFQGRKNRHNVLKTGHAQFSFMHTIHDNTLRGFNKHSTNTHLMIQYTHMLLHEHSRLTHCEHMTYTP